MRTFVFGKSKHPMYSDNAFTRMHEALTAAKQWPVELKQRSRWQPVLARQRSGHDPACRIEADQLVSRSDAEIQCSRSRHMKTRAAVARAKAQPLSLETIDLEGPHAGEVLVEIKATGICHTDEFTLSGADPEGIFPSILGHEGAGVVVDVGAGVTSLKKGDHVIRSTRRNAGSANTASAARRTSASRSAQPRARG